MLIYSISGHIRAFYEFVLNQDSKDIHIEELICYLNSQGYPNENIKDMLCNLEQKGHVKIDWDMKYLLEIKSITLEYDGIEDYLLLNPELYNTLKDKVIMEIIDRQQIRSDVIADRLGECLITIDHIFDIFAKSNLVEFEQCQG